MVDLGADLLQNGTKLDVVLFKANNIEIVRECQLFFTFELQSIQCNKFEIKYGASDNLLCKIRAHIK